MSARLAGSLASHADVVRGSSRVPGAETRDEPLWTFPYGRLRVALIIENVMKTGMKKKK